MKKISRPRYRCCPRNIPSSLARKIAWWTNHVWTTAKRRDAVRFLLSPELNAYGLSPHDIDVCVTHIANAVDEPRWETARWGTLFAAAGLAPVRIVARWVQRPRLNVGAGTAAHTAVRLCVRVSPVISGVLLPSSLEEKGKHWVFGCLDMWDRGCVCLETVQIERPSVACWPSFKQDVLPDSNKRCVSFDCRNVCCSSDSSFA
ncbi:hypothetical protein A0H81_00073 [Grifola frondosa]|uniref:Uncharacterized protein n=1 Tax=Grifola frondosa TaxID=5627 RepID=A0A1C7MSW6_GRIFR|nr:hypothetical protein A0H81_00073 [Grifola frondosa]